MNLSKAIVPSTLKAPELSERRCVRLVTGDKPNSGVSYPNAGVRFVFLNDKGECALRLLSRVSEEGEVRFERGSVDVICFDDLNVDEPSQLWISPEQGEWDLHSVILEEAKPKVFMQEALVGTDDNPCAMVSLRESPACDEEVRAQNMLDYERMKKNILNAIFNLTLAGSWSTYAATRDADVSLAFLEGGAVGLLYMYMLEKQIDFTGSYTPRKAFLFPLVSSPVRLLMVSVLSVSSIGFSEQRLLVPFALGFFMYKVAVILVGRY